MAFSVVEARGVGRHHIISWPRLLSWSSRVAVANFLANFDSTSHGYHASMGLSVTVWPSGLTTEQITCEPTSSKEYLYYNPNLLSATHLSLLLQFANRTRKHVSVSPLPWSHLQWKNRGTTCTYLHSFIISSFSYKITTEFIPRSRSKTSKSGSKQDNTKYQRARVFYPVCFFPGLEDNFTSTQTNKKHALPKPTVILQQCRHNTLSHIAFFTKAKQLNPADRTTSESVLLLLCRWTI